MPAWCSGCVRRRRDHGLGVIFITHNPHHAYMVGDHMVLLNRGKMALDTKRDDITLDELTQQMAGGDELDALSHKLRRGSGNSNGSGNGEPVEKAAEDPAHRKDTV